MTKISSNMIFVKKIFPALWFGVLVIMAVLQYKHSTGNLQQLLIFLGFLSLMGLVVFLILRKFVWILADEVYDCGDHLLVRRRGEEEIVPLSNVMNVSAVTYMNPPRITLRLVHPGKFGPEVSFSPVGQAMLNPFAKNPVAEDLIVRVDRARRGT